MRRLLPTGRSVAVPFLVGLCLLLTSDAWMPVLAAAQATNEQETPPADPEAQRAARKAEKERAKQARIEEYLRKREERRAKQAMEKQAAAEARAASDVAPPTAAPPAPVVGTVAVQPEQPEKQTKKKRSRRTAETTAAAVELPRNLVRIHEDLRRSPLGQDPSVVRYIDLIETGNASAHQLAAFGSFLAQTGRIREGIEYYAVALDMEHADPVLWMNVGTLHRQLGEYGIAAETYAEALAIDGNNAFAHYNLGAVLDLQGKYEEAIEEYKMALTLDPSLGDPMTNPQAANNERLVAVKLMLYKQKAGSLGLPLIDVPGGSAGPEDDDR